MSRRKHGGYSVLEFIIATALSIPLLMLLLHTIQVVHRLALTASDRRTITISSLALYRALDQISADIDSHPFNLIPRSHINGDFTFYDGSPVSHRQIGPKSAGITSVRLRFSDALTLSQEGSDFTGCMMFRDRGNLLSGSPIHGFLLITPTGYSEVLGVMRPGETQRCYTLEFTLPKKSMIWSLISVHELQFAFVAIPIERIQTIFRDRKGNLRALRFSGSTILLSQPIANGIEPFSIQIESSPIEGHVEIILNDQHFKALTFEHRVPRTNFRNVLWNLPL